MLPTNCLQDEYEQDLSTCDSGRQNPLDAMTTSTVGKRIRRMPSSRCAAQFSPAASHSGSAVRAQITLAPEDLLLIVEGIAASGLASKRAEQFAARACQEAAVATREATRAATAVAELLGIPSRQPPRKSLFRSTGQRSDASQISPSLKETTAPDAAAVASVAEATAPLISDGGERTRLPQCCDFSPLAPPHFRADNCTPRVEPPRPSRTHRFAHRDKGIKFQSPPTSRQAFSPATQPQNPGTQCEDRTATANELACVSESMPLATLVLKALFPLLPQSQVRQQKLTSKLRLPDGQQSRCAYPNQSPVVHSMDSTSMFYHQTCKECSSLSEAVNSETRIQPETQEGNKVVQDSTQDCLLTTHDQKTTCSEISTTLRNQPSSFVDDGLRTTTEDRSQAPPGVALLRTHTEDPQCCALACGREAPRYNDILHAVEQAKEDSEVQVAHSLDLVARARGRDCFPPVALNSFTVSSTVTDSAQDQEGDTVVEKTAHAGDKGASITKNGGYPRTEGKGGTKEISSDRHSPRRHSSLGSRPCAAARFEPYCAMHLGWQSYDAARKKAETSRNGDTEANVKSNKRTAANAKEEDDFREKKLTRIGCEDAGVETIHPLENFPVKASHCDVAPSRAGSREASISPPCSRGYGDNSDSPSTLSVTSDFTGLPHDEGMSETLILETNRSGIGGEEAHQLKGGECNCRGHSTNERPLPQSHQGGQETPGKEHSLGRQRGGVSPRWLNPEESAQPRGTRAQCHVSHSTSSVDAQEHSAGDSREAPSETHAHDVLQRQPAEYMHHALQEATSESESSCAVDDIKVSEVMDGAFGVNTGGYDRESETHVDRRSHDGRSCGRYPFLDELKMALLARRNASTEQVQRLASKKGSLEDLRYLRRVDEHRTGSASLGRGSNSKRVSLQESLSSSSRLTAQSRPLGAPVPASSSRHAHQTGGEADATTKNTCRACTRSEGTGLRSRCLGDAQGGKFRRVSESKLASVPPGAAVKEHQNVGNRPLNLMNATSSKIDGHRVDCDPRFDGVHLSQNKAEVEGSLTETVPSMQHDSGGYGSAVRGAKGDNMTDAGNHNRCNATGRSIQAISSATTSPTISTKRCRSPYVRSSSRCGTTSDSANSPEKLTDEHDRTIRSSTATSNRRLLGTKVHSNDDSDVSQLRLKEDGLNTEKAPQCLSALQLVLQQLFPKGLDNPAGGACSSGGNKIRLTGMIQRPEVQTHGQSSEVPDNLEEGPGDASAADSMTTAVEEENGKYISDVPGVSYRSAPHCGWRFRWKDHENG